MSVQFGRWNTDGKPVERSYLEKVKSVVAPYGPDDGASFDALGISMLYYAFHTTTESRRETQPHVTESGAVITWDGRLDNRADLIRQLRAQTNSSADVSIVAAAYQAWGTDCLARLLGDWALSVWDPKSRSLLLAKDPIGTRHLYYSIERQQVSWSTILDPLVLFANKSFALCEEYLAAWLSFFPATHLTPYIGICSVSPSCFVLIRDGLQTVTQYWEFNPRKKIRYGTDAEYEEHFRTVFAEAVRRRLRSDSPVLAELSGGMDSSSIVCMADLIIARGAAEAPRLDTISYYDDSEPNWNERPYFTRVEQKRGRTGTHIDAGSQDFFKFDFEDTRFLATPASSEGRGREIDRLVAACMVSQGNRVVLSGIGGDEFTGGVPNPNPELQDLLFAGRFRALAHQLVAWALNKRKPWFHLLLEATREFLPPALVGVPEHKRPAPWLHPAFVKRNRAALTGYPHRLKMFGSLPSFQTNSRTVEALRRQLACSDLSSDPLREKRYPYLDLDMLEFLSAIPREQLIRPGRRRALMRRALVDIIPDELLNRKRKAFLTRGPRLGASEAALNLQKLGRQLLTSSLGIVNRVRLLEALQNAQQDNGIPIVTLLRTLRIEVWLRRQPDRHVLYENVRPREAVNSQMRAPTNHASPFTSNTN